MKLDYLEILKRAWQITWTHKWLWLFGFLAALGSGGSNFSNFSRYSTSSSNSTATSSATANAGQFASTYLVLIIFVGLILLVIGLFVTIAAIVAQGALIGSGAAADREEPVSMSLGWQAGLKSFWRLFGLGLLVGLIIFVLVAIPTAVAIAAGVMGAAAADSAATTGLLCLIPVGILYLMLFVVVVIVLVVASNYASRYIVIEGSGVFASLRQGFALMRLRWLDTLLLYIIMSVIGAVVGAVLLIPGAAIGLPALALIIGGVAAESVIMVTAGIFFGLLAILVMAVLNGVFVAYSSVAWTLAYRRLIVA